LFLKIAQTPRGEIERLVPGGRTEALRRAQQRVQQAIGMIPLKIPFHAFRAEHAAIERKIFPRLETRDAVNADFDLDAAMLISKTAVLLHQFLGDAAGLAPSPRRDVIEVRSVALPQHGKRVRRPSHVPPPGFSFEPSTVSCVCTRGTTP